MAKPAAGWLAVGCSRHRGMRFAASDSKFQEAAHTAGAVLPPSQHRRQQRAWGRTWGGRGVAASSCQAGYTSASSCSRSRCEKPPLSTVPPSASRTGGWHMEAGSGRPLQGGTAGRGTNGASLLSTASSNRSCAHVGHLRCLSCHAAALRHRYLQSACLLLTGSVDSGMWIDASDTAALRVLN